MPNILTNLLNEFPEMPVPEILNRAFLEIDVLLGEKKDMSSGTTAIVAFLRVEEREVDGQKTKKVLQS
jgi:hypothetical protein